MYGYIAVEVITRVAPSFHGLYRAVICTPFPWSAREWYNLSTKVEGIFTTSLVDRLNSLLTEYLEMADQTDHGHDDLNGDTRLNQDEPDLTDQEHPPTKAFVSTFVMRYVTAERPPSGYFLVCSLTEIQWVILAQVLSPPTSVDRSPQNPESRKLAPSVHAIDCKPDDDDDAAAANDAWAHLLKEAVTVIISRAGDSEEELDQSLEVGGVKPALDASLISAMKCFEDLLIQLEEMDVEPSVETYAYETMAESLVRGFPSYMTSGA